MKKLRLTAIMLLLAFAVSASASAAPCAAGQRWLFGGKEREHAGGSNSYDYGARNLTPLGSWSSADPLATDFYSLSPFSYCGGDPINYVDPDGKLIIFINGMHTGDGGNPEYWGGVDKLIMDEFGDQKAIYVDGAVGGTKGLPFNLNPYIREFAGMYLGNKFAEKILNTLEDGENIKFVTHSMGAAHAKGVIQGLSAYGEKNGIDVMSRIDFELDIAPFQPLDQEACSGVPTFVLQNKFDCIALPFEMEGAKCEVTHKKIYKPFSEHQIKSYGDLIDKIGDIFPDLNKYIHK